MPESVSSNRNNQVISNLINGDLRLYGRYDNKEFGASVEVYNNAYVEYIAIVEGRTSMVPANKAKHITAVLDLEPEYIEDENNINCNFDLDCEPDYLFGHLANIEIDENNDILMSGING